MSLERKDVKVNFDADIHAALKAIADQNQTTMADLVESIVAPAIRARIHEVIALAERFRRAGITRNPRESSEDQPPTG